MTARELEALLRLLSHYTESEIDQRTRPLRDRNLIPHGPRGANAPHLEPHHAALVLLTMVSRRAVDAGKTAVRSAKLRLAPHRAINLPQETELLSVLAKAFSADQPHIKRRFEALVDGSAAWVSYDQSGALATALFLEARAIKAATKKAHLYESTGASLCNHRFVLGEGAFADLIGEFNRTSDKSGWRLGDDNTRALGSTDTTGAKKSST